MRNIFLSKSEHLPEYTEFVQRGLLLNIESRWLSCFDEV